MNEMFEASSSGVPSEPVPAPVQEEEHVDLTEDQIKEELKKWIKKKYKIKLFNGVKILLEEAI